MSQEVSEALANRVGGMSEFSQPWKEGMGGVVFSTVLDMSFYELLPGE
jgi:hypothetical protein